MFLRRSKTRDVKCWRLLFKNISCCRFSHFYQNVDHQIETVARTTDSFIFPTTIPKVPTHRPWIQLKSRISAHCEPVASPLHLATLVPNVRRNPQRDSAVEDVYVTSPTSQLPDQSPRHKWKSYYSLIWTKKKDWTVCFWRVVWANVTRPLSRTGRSCPHRLLQEASKRVIFVEALGGHA